MLVLDKPEVLRIDCPALARVFCPCRRQIERSRSSAFKR
jgi:hypothetical protein